MNQPLIKSACKVKMWTKLFLENKVYMLPACDVLCLGSPGMGSEWRNTQTFVNSFWLFSCKGTRTSSFRNGGEKQCPAYKCKMLFWVVIGITHHFTSWWFFSNLDKSDLECTLIVGTPKTQSPSHTHTTNPQPHGTTIYLVLSVHQAVLVPLCGTVLIRLQGKGGS